MVESDARGLATQRAAFDAAFDQLGYCGGAQLAARRASHFPQLAGVTYLDHAAATLYSVQQLAAAQRELGGSLFCNPHSQLGGGLDASTAAIAQLRQLTLEMLRAPAHEYEVRTRMHARPRKTAHMHTCAQALDSNTDPSHRRQQP